MTQRIGKLATVGIVLALIVLAANAWVGYRNAHQYIEKEEWVRHTQSILVELETVLSAVTDAATGQRGYLLTDNPDFLKPYDASHARATASMQALQKLTIDNGTQQARIGQLDTAVNATFENMKMSTALRQQGRAALDAQPDLLTQGKQSMDQVRALVSAAKAEEETLLLTRTASSKASFDKALVTSGVATAVAMLMVILTYAMVIRDQSVRRRVHEKMQVTEARKAAVFDAVLDSIVGMDDQGKIIEWNAAAERTFGYKAKQALGQDMADLIIPPQHRAAHRAGLARYQQTGEGEVLNKRIEITALRKGGQEFPVELAITPIHTDGPAMFTGYLVDITDRKGAEEALRLSEERSRLLLESSGEGVYGIDLEGICTFANAACAKLLGYDDPAALIGTETHDLFHHHRPDGSPYPRLECPIYKSFQVGKGVQVDDEVFFRRDGSSFPVEYRSAPIIRGDERIGAVVTFVDITARRRAEQGMRLRESALRSVAQGVFITDPARSDEPIIYVNAAFEHLTGFAWQEIKGREITFIAGVETDPAALAGVRDALRKNLEHNAELLLYRKDATPFWATIALAPVADSAGRLTHFVGLMTDVSERRKAEEALKAALEAAEAATSQAEMANASKSEFLANMSHELRTPLNAVIMYSELLQEEAEDQDIKGFIPDLDKIRNAGKHLLALVNGVLDLSKVEAGKMELYLETFNVESMIQDVVVTVQPLVDKNSNQLSLTCGPALGEMHADLTKVRQVLFNLLSNACKFTEKGTVRVEVGRSAENGVDVITFRVSDSGIGMTQPQIDKLFQPFTQADASTTRKFGGTGLGLAISKRFCEMMGGEVTVISTPGQGSTFTVRLPTRVTDKTSVGTPERTGRATEPAAAGRTTVLVVDDESAVRDLMTKTLTSEGIRTVTAADGEQGLRLAKEFQPDVIFLDVLMPKMDGWAVLTALKADPKLASIPVIMLTMMNDQEMGYLLGATEYLTKPIDRDRLTTVLQRYRPTEGACGVLLVEDDEPTRQVIRRTLTKQGWTVAEAENGRIALERMARLAPSLILLDLMMPEMDGFEFLAELRKNEHWVSIPVVILTSKDITPEERTQLSGKVERILQKGAYSREALLSEVRKIVTQCAPKHLPSEPSPPTGAVTG